MYFYFHRTATSSVKTASDTQKGGDSDSSIRSMSGADARDESKSESILEDISQGKTVIDDRT